MIGKPLTILNEVDSSNNYATAQALQGLAQHGSAYMALHQTAGKGQRGRIWQDQPGLNLAMSIVLDMNQAVISRQFAVSTCIALSIYDYLQQLGLEETRIKWPNDIYWRDRKAVGILLENKLKGQKWQWAIAGIGMNVNQTTFDPLLGKKAVSLKQITGQHFELEQVAEQLCQHIDTRFEEFIDHKDEQLLADYNQALFKRGQCVDLGYQGKSYNCQIEQVDDAGRLWVSGAPVPFFQFGEVEWQLPIS